MKTLTKELWMEIPNRRQIVLIHDDVERLVGESGITDVLVLINAMHITASVFINDNALRLHLGPWNIFLMRVRRPQAEADFGKDDRSFKTLSRFLNIPTGSTYPVIIDIKSLTYASSGKTDVLARISTFTMGQHRQRFAPEPEKVDKFC